MAVSARLFGQALVSALNKEIDFDSDVIKVALCPSSYVPNQDTHRYRSDITEVAAGGGYATGGATVAGPSVSYDAGTNTIKLDGGDVSWAASTITARYAVVYDSSPATLATQPLIALIDFGEDVVSTNGTFAINFDAAGIATITVAA